MSPGEKAAQQLRDAAALLDSMAADVARDIDERYVLSPITVTVEVGASDKVPTLSVRKEYYARKRQA